MLGSIPPVYRKAVLEQCQRKALPRGATIWAQGEAAEYVVFLYSGKTISSHQSRNGKTGATGFWCAGDLLGASDIGGSGTRQMTIRCLAPCVIYTLSLDRFDDLVRRFPELAQAIIRAMSVRLRWVSLLAVTLETQSAFERICTALIALADRFGTPCEQGMLIDLTLTNDDLAAIAGVSRQFTNMTLHDLRLRGLLVIRKRSLIIVNPIELEAIALS